jgi:hypothetical protein
MLLVVVATSITALPVLAAAARQRYVAGTSAVAETAAAPIMDALGRSASTAALI